MTRLQQQLFSVLGVVTLLFLSALLWLKYDRGFPRLPTGTYAGQIKDNNNQTFTYLFVESDLSQQYLSFTFLVPGSTESVSDQIDLSLYKSTGEQNYLSLRLLVPELGLSQVAGIRRSEGKFSGTLHSEKIGSQYTWELQNVPFSLNRSDTQSLALHIEMLSPLLEMRYRNAEELEYKKNWITNMEQLLGNTQLIEKLRTQLPTVIQESADVAQKSLEQREQKLEDARRRVELASRVFAGLRERELAREIINAEERLILPPSYFRENEGV